MKKFDTFWNDLIIKLRRSQKIKNWTVKKGFFGEDFTAQTNRNSIVCITQKGSEQCVSRKDFELVYENWEGYISGRISRSDLCESRFTKYTISIIHQFLKD